MNSNSASFRKYRPRGTRGSGYRSKNKPQQNNQAAQYSRAPEQSSTSVGWVKSSPSTRQRRERQARGVVDGENFVFDNDNCSTHLSTNNGGPRNVLSQVQNNIRSNVDDNRYHSHRKSPSLNQSDFIHKTPRRNRRNVGVIGGMALRTRSSLNRMSIESSSSARTSIGSDNGIVDKRRGSKRSSPFAIEGLIRDNIGNIGESSFFETSPKSFLFNAGKRIKK